MIDNMMDQSQIIALVCNACSAPIQVPFNAFNQSTNQPIMVRCPHCSQIQTVQKPGLSQHINQSHNQPIHQQQHIQRNNQPINQQINQPMNQTMNQQISQPVLQQMQPMIQPMMQPMTQSLMQPFNQLLMQPFNPITTSPVQPLVPAFNSFLFNQAISQSVNQSNNQPQPISPIIIQCHSCQTIVTVTPPPSNQSINQSLLCPRCNAIIGNRNMFNQAMNQPNLQKINQSIDHSTLTTPTSNSASAEQSPRSMDESSSRSKNLLSVNRARSASLSTDISHRPFNPTINQSSSLNSPAAHRATTPSTNRSSNSSSSQSSSQSSNQSSAKSSGRSSKRSSLPSRRARRDPSVPRRSSNAYMIFCKEYRHQLKRTEPNLAFGKLGQRLGEIWRSMSMEQRRPYEERANIDRTRYKEQINEHLIATMRQHVVQQQASSIQSNNQSNNQSDNQTENDISTRRHTDPAINEWSRNRSNNQANNQPNNQLHASFNQFGQILMPTFNPLNITNQSVNQTINPSMLHNAVSFIPPQPLMQSNNQSNNQMINPSYLMMPMQSLQVQRMSSSGSVQSAQSQ